MKMKKIHEEGYGIKCNVNKQMITTLQVSKRFESIVLELKILTRIEDFKPICGTLKE